MSSDDDLIPVERQKRHLERDEEAGEGPDLKKPFFGATATSESSNAPLATSSSSQTNTENGQTTALSHATTHRSDSERATLSLMSLLSSLIGFHSDLLKVPLDTLELHSPPSQCPEYVLFGGILKASVKSSAALTKTLSRTATLLLGEDPRMIDPKRQYQKETMEEVKSILEAWSVWSAKMKSINTSKLVGTLYYSNLDHAEAALASLRRELDVEPTHPLTEAKLDSVFALLSPQKPIRDLLSAGSEEPFSSSSSGSEFSSSSNHHHSNHQNNHQHNQSALQLDSITRNKTLESLKHFIFGLLPSLKNLIQILPEFSLFVNSNFGNSPNPQYIPLTLSTASLIKFSLDLNVHLFKFINFLLLLLKSHIESLESEDIENLHKRCIDEVVDYLRAMAQFNVVREYPAVQKLRLDFILQAVTTFVHLCLSEHHQLNIEEDTMRTFFNCFPPHWTSSDGSTSQQLLEKAVVDLVKSGRVQFPFKRFNNGMQVQEMFRSLQLWNLDSSRIVKRRFVVHGLENRTGDFFPHTYQGPNDQERDFFCIDYDESEYERINIITDYFQERERMSGRVKNANESPLEYWDSNAASLVAAELKSQNYQRLRARDVRERIFRQTKECTQFKVTLVKAVLQKLNAHRYLDMSAGWGDRLIGAIGTESIERYVGVDPNLDLKRGHDEIIATLAEPNRRNQFTVIYQPFQSAALPQGATFDLVFTSPPYFDFEIYSDSPTQSIQTHRSFDIWLTDFLLVSIMKAWDVLEDNGHLAIHITDTKSMKCCELMNLFIQSRLPSSVYEGIIGSLGQRKDVVRPIWVWRKDSANANPKRKQQAEDFILKYHNNRWHAIEKVAKFSPGT
jgi:16S rRNA G966 N2-methylase RsmD